LFISCVIKIARFLWDYRLDKRLTIFLWSFLITMILSGGVSSWSLCWSSFYVGTRSVKKDLTNTEFYWRIKAFFSIINRIHQLLLLITLPILIFMMQRLTPLLLLLLHIRILLSKHWLQHRFTSFILLTPSILRMWLRSVSILLFSPINRKISCFLHILM